MSFDGWETHLSHSAAALCAAGALALGIHRRFTRAKLAEGDRSYYTGAAERALEAAAFAGGRGGSSSGRAASAGDALRAVPVGDAASADVPRPAVANVCGGCGFDGEDLEFLLAREKLGSAGKDAAVEEGAKMLAVKQEEIAVLNRHVSTMSGLVKQQQHVYDEERPQSMKMIGKSRNQIGVENQLRNEMAALTSKLDSLRVGRLAGDNCPAGGGGTGGGKGGGKGGGGSGAGGGKPEADPEQVKKSKTQRSI